MKHFRWFRLAPVVLIVVAGCSSSHTAKSTTTSLGPTTTSSLVTTPTTTTGGTTTSTTTATGGPLPAGFTVTDLTWVSDTQGWALGTAPCIHAPCTSVVHTLDGGRTWAGLPAPKAYLPNDPAVTGSSGCSTTVACVAGIRFANATTGYIFGDSSLWLTTNGGHTWAKRSSDVTDALEIDGATVIRVVNPGNLGCPPGCAYGVEAAPVGTTTWHALPAPAITGDSASLAVRGNDLYLAVAQNPAGGAEDEHATLARSTDGGAHWTSATDPCGVTASGNEADATAVSAAPGGFLAVGCTARAAGEAGFVVVSSNAGASFGPHRGNLLSSVPATERVDKIAAATGQRLAVVVDSGNAGSISLTNDAGVTWTVTQTTTFPSAATSTPNMLYLGFEDATTGRAVLDSRTILTTTDGAGHWTPYTFP